MNCIYIKENTKYTFDELSSRLNLNDNKTRDIINQLLRLGVLKTNVKLIYDEIDINIGEYSFTYVGLVIIEDIVIRCYPKYISSKEQIDRKFKQILKVLERYNNKHNPLNMSIDTSESKESSKIALYMHIIRDYIVNGVYTQFIDEREFNGNGDIDWNLTINEINPFIQNEKPYYLDLYTYTNVQEDQNFFMRLHQAIVAECLRIFEEDDLLDLFDLEAFHVSDEHISAFGEEEFICQKLLKELNIQYNDQKRSQLIYMYQFLQNKASSTDDIQLLCYGTQIFHSVWESVCSDVFENHKKTRIKEIIPSFNINSTLNDLIKYPVWNIYDNSYKALGTLIPDVLHLTEDTLYIIDAKYYHLPTSYPGVSDLTKQFLYKLSYQDFAEENSLAISNVFLFPSESNEEYENLGYVALEFLPQSMQIDENRILVYKLSAEKLFEKYLKRQKMEIEVLDHTLI